MFLVRCLAGLGLALFPAAVGGQEPKPVGIPFQVNSYTQGEQEVPDLAVGPQGSFVVVWQSGEFPFTDYDVRAQRFASDGSFLGTEFIVNSYTTSDQTVAAAALAPSGDFVIVWQSGARTSRGPDGDRTGIQGQLYAADGSRVGSEFQINSYTTGYQSRPDVVADDLGNFVVVWQNGEFVFTDYDVRAQRFSFDGTPLGPELRISPGTASDSSHPRIAMRGDGGFVVVWSSYYGDGGVHTRLFAPDGTAIGPASRLGIRRSFNPAVAMDSKGQFVVVWRSYEEFFDQSIRAQRFTSMGGLLGPEFQVNTFTSGIHTVPAVSMEATDDFLVVWEHERNAGFDAILGQRFSQNGVLLGGEIQLNKEVKDQLSVPKIAIGEDGYGLVVWQSGRSTYSGPESGDGNFAGIHGRFLDVTDDTVLGLRDGRFEVSVDWRDFQDQVGEASIARLEADASAGSTRLESDDSALFWFFSPDNWELLVKVLDGCRISNSFWIFAAATTSVEYELRVTDTWSGVTRTYFNSLGTAAPAITDIGALATCDTPAPLTPLCLPDSHIACLGEERFQVEVVWKDFHADTGLGSVAAINPGEQPLAASADSGVFWFFSPDNWEMQVKVLDACGVNDRLWVFAGATTTVEYTLRVEDTWTGEVREYFNPLGNAADAVTDTSAFATCDAILPAAPGRTWPR